jgi:hypothetical protein
MSNTKKVVKIKESALVDLIDNIVKEAVEVKKTEWIQEQTKKENDKISMLESKVADLTKKFNKLTEGKK